MAHHDTVAPGSIHLIGGGRDDARLAPMFARFLGEALDGRTDAASPPRVHLLLVREPGDDGVVERFAAPLRTAGADVIAHVIDEGEVFAADAVAGADALAVGGGLTPAYLAAVAPVAAAVRERVAAGAPYVGFSAGSAVASARAIVGGYRLDGVEIAVEDAGEELDEVTVADGLGLVPFSVDVHAAQWGTLSRLVAAVEAGAVAEGYAVDEHTALVVRGSRVEVTGEGAVWHVVGDQGVRVARLRATPSR